MATDIVAQFGFEFTSNLDALKKQWDAAKKGNDELVASLKKLDKELDKSIKIKLDDDSLEQKRKHGRKRRIDDEEKINKTRTKGNDILRRRVTQLAGLAASYMSAKAIAAGFTDAFTGSLDVAFQSGIIDVSAAKIQNWSRIVQRAGGDSGAAFKTFSAISQEVGNLETLGESSLGRMASRFGVSLMSGNKAKQSDQIFLELNDAINAEGMSKSARQSVFAQLGWDESMLKIGRQGSSVTRGQLSEVRRTQHQMTPEDTKIVKDLNTEMRELQQSMESLFSETLLDNAQAIFDVLEGANNLLNNMRDGEDSADVIPDAQFFKDFSKGLIPDFLIEGYEALQDTARQNNETFNTKNTSTTNNDNSTAMGGQTFNINGGDGMNIAREINNSMTDAFNLTRSSRLA